MTKVKLCGLSRNEDIEVANNLKPEYIGFVFAKKSKRYVESQKAQKLKKLLSPEIKAVGVFVDEDIENIIALLNKDIIDLAQLHGHEDENYIRHIKKLTNKPVIKALRINETADISHIEESSADFVLLDSGAGTGEVFDWKKIENIKRPYFLAGGLDVNNVCNALNLLNPYAVDVSSGIESDGVKDGYKMAAFVANVRKEIKL